MRQHVGSLATLAPGGTRRKHELVVEEVECLDLMVLDGKRDEHEVEIAPDQFPDQGFCDGPPEGARSGREIAVAARGSQPQQIGRDRRDGPELERSRKHPLTMPGVVEEVAHRGKVGASTADDLLALLGQLDPRLPPLDEAHLQLVLKLLDLLVSGGWVMAQFRRLTEMQRLG
jgi:hypothetical protein